MTLRLSEIWIYPVKSLGGISLPKAKVKGKGLEYDRRWMLIDSDGVAMTQRAYNEMALLKVSFHNGKLQIAKMHNGSITGTAMFDPETPPEGSSIKAHVWDDEVEVAEVRRDLSEWFSHHLAVPCRLVTFPEENPRQVDPRYSLDGEHLALADAYPFLLIGQSSLDDLNSRLKEPVPMNRFRPNFVFTGGLPFQEDDWKSVNIGNLRFRAAKKCDRCILTTINQETGHKATEPLRTLSTYRKIGNKVFFGQNLIGLEEGIVSVGDPIIHS